MVGSRISAKAVHITNLAECVRRYGKNKKTKVLYGTVVENLSAQNNPNTRRIKNIIVGDFDLSRGTIKRASLNIRSLKAVDSVPITEDGNILPITPPGAPAEDDIGVVKAVVANDDAEVDEVVLASANE